MERHETQAVLITGVYGVGKSSVIEEMADVLEKLKTPYAALDLDWLGWFDTGRGDDAVHDRTYWRNLEAVLANYRAIGIERYLLAQTVENEQALRRFRAVVAMPLHVVRLTADLATIQARLGTSVTSGRKDDLRLAGIQLEEGIGVGLEDFTIANDRPIHQVAQDVIDRVGW